MANLVELFDNIVQMQNLNGVPLAAGKLYVYALGRTRLMDSWSDVDGESLNPNPIILDDAGQAHVYVSDDFDYTLVVCDQYNNEIFSLDKYLYSEGSHSHADVAVAPSEHIGVSSYHVGEVTVYVPYITGNFGKTYEGIDPIVVNNDINKISANNIPLGVQDPLYFVEDSETACIIGCSAQTEIPSELSGKWDNASDTVIANSAQWSENTTYEAGSYVDIDNNTISVTGLQPAGNYQSAGNYVSASELENLQPKGDYYSASNPSGFLINEDITGKLDTTAFSTVSGDFLTAIPSEYVTENTLQSGLSSKLDSTAFSTVSGNFLTAHQSLEGYATEQWVEDKGYITGVDIPESATWNATTETVSSNSAQWGATNPQIPVTGINGIKISESGDKVVFEVSADYALADDLTGKQDSLTFGYKDIAISSIDESAIYDNSAHARITTLAGRISDLSSNKLDTSAFSDVSGTFLTAHQSLDGLMSADLLEISDNKITGYNGSAFAGGGVSGTNVVFVPRYDGANYGDYYSARISGDVVVTTGSYFNDDIYPGTTIFSLSSVGASIGNKLDKNKIEASNTIKIINNHAEVTDKAYRPTGFTNISTDYLDVRNNSISIYFMPNDSYLYSAIVTVETTASGSYLPDGWSLVSYENNSAIFTKYYPLNENNEHFSLYNINGWGDFTNAEGSATVYSALELATLAFKDEISGITYTTGSI